MNGAEQRAPLPDGRCSAHRPTGRTRHSAGLPAGERGAQSGQLSTRSLKSALCYFYGQLDALVSTLERTHQPQLRAVPLVRDDGGGPCAD